VAGTAGALIGWLLSRAFAPSGIGTSVLVAAIVGMVGAGVCAGVLMLLDRSLLTSLRALRPQVNSEPGP
jgi:uncharacterized membrane protein YeaQ/YmgE (transglycosylase-associated protein family)